MAFFLAPQAVIQRYNELKQETSSLQSVVEMRGQELRTVTHHLELVSTRRCFISCVRISRIPLNERRRGSPPTRCPRCASATSRSPTPSRTCTPSSSARRPRRGISRRFLFYSRRTRPDCVTSTGDSCPSWPSSRRPTGRRATRSGC